MIKSIAHHDTIELAERYDQVSEGQYNNGLTLIANLGVKKGQTVLDIGCGTGRLTSRVAKIVGDTGQVIGIDPSKERIEIARRNVPDSPRSNISLEIGDANSLYHFQNNSFDIVYLNIVFHWIDNKKMPSPRFIGSSNPEGFWGSQRETGISHTPLRSSPIGFLHSQSMRGLHNKGGHRANRSMCWRWSPCYMLPAIPYWISPQKKIHVTLKVLSNVLKMSRQVPAEPFCRMSQRT